MMMVRLQAGISKIVMSLFNDSYRFSGTDLPRMPLTKTCNTPFLLGLCSPSSLSTLSESLFQRIVRLGHRVVF